MKTYQDFLFFRDGGAGVEGFILEAIAEHKISSAYRTAVEAEAYYKNLNPTIAKYQKLLYTVSGKAVPDNFSANYKLASNVYFRFVTQTVQYLLGYGAVFDDDNVKNRLGGDEFDRQLQAAAVESLNGGVSFGFFNYDHLNVFSLTEFVPLYDEESGALCAGIRFWQMDEDKPLRATLYELDGYTEYIQKQRGSGLEILSKKRSYIQKVVSSKIDGTAIYDGENYPSFPIIPLYSPRRQSSIIGFKRKIDCHDLIESGYANDVDDASLIYWTISNAGGMDDIDLAKFIEHMKTVRAAVVEDEGAKAEAHTVDVPCESREAILKRLEDEMYRDFMVLNLDTISSGQTTATAIKAAYEPMNLFSNMFESEILVFVSKILSLISLEGHFQLERDRIVNELEQAQTVQTQIETYLALKGTFDDDTIIKLCADALELGEEETERIIKAVTAEESERFGGRAANGIAEEITEG